MNFSGNPIFSIIVPVYNVAQYIEKCLESISKQTLENIEVLVVDDGSTDSSLALCRKFAESHKNFRIYSKENEGQGVARNYAIDMSRGDYVCYVDSDDWIEPGLCAEMLEILEKTDADFVNFGLDYVTPSGKVIKKFDQFEVRELFGSEIFHRALLDDQILSSPVNKVYRRKFLMDHYIRFPPLRANEDVYYAKAISLVATKTVFVPKVYYHALIRSGSTTRKMSISNFSATEDLIKFERDKFNHKGDDRFIENLFRAHVIKIFSYLLIQAAFRIERYSEYIACFDVAHRCGFVEYAKSSDVTCVLRLKNKLMVKLCGYPAILRVMAGGLKKIGVVLY